MRILLKIVKFKSKDIPGHRISPFRISISFISHGETFSSSNGFSFLLTENSLFEGLIRVIKNDAWAGTNNVADFSTLTTISDETGGLDYDFAGKTWEQAGARFINYYMKNRARWSKNRNVIGIVGDAALLGINQLVESNSMMTLETKQTDYGIQIHRWHSVFGTIDLLLHPLFSHEPTDNFRMVLFEPKEIMFRPIKGRDTKFLKDPNFDKGGDTAIDARNEGFRTEGGMDWGNARGGCVLDGVGKDNAQG